MSKLTVKDLRELIIARWHDIEWYDVPERESYLTAFDTLVEKAQVKESDILYHSDCDHDWQREMRVVKQSPFKTPEPDKFWGRYTKCSECSAEVQAIGEVV